MREDQRNEIISLRKFLEETSCAQASVGRRCLVTHILLQTSAINEATQQSQQVPTADQSRGKRQNRAGGVTENVQGGKGQGSRVWVTASKSLVDAEMPSYGSG